MMKMAWVLLSIIFFIVFPQLALAIEAPVQVGPTNNSTTADTAITWQTPSYTLYVEGNPYRVQIDDDQTFVSVNKDHYTSSNSYAPDLSLGTWYWRIKAKDVSGNWSDWSTVWSFTLVAPSPTPTPTSTPTPSPTPTTTPTPTITPTSSPTTVPSKIPTPTTIKSFPTKKPTPTPTPTKPTPTTSLPSSILGTSTEGPTPTVQPENQTSPSPIRQMSIIGGGAAFILAGILFLTFIVRKKSDQI